MNHATVIVCSDTCSKNPTLDVSGNYVKKRLEDTLMFENVTLRIVQDDIQEIRDCVQSSLRDSRNAIILTVGGTGPCPRDVTPEATSSLYEKHCSGIVAALHMNSLKNTPHAALSRLTAGIVGNCVIINFPGKKKACEECFDCIESFLGHLLEQVRFDKPAIDETHRMLATEENGSTPEPSRFIKLEPEETTAPIRTESPYPMIDIDEALGILGDLSTDLYNNEYTYKFDSLETSTSIMGDVLAQDLESRTSVPPVPVSMMDGYVLYVPESLRNSSPMQIPTAKLLRDLDMFNKRAERKQQAGGDAGEGSFCYQVNTGGQVPYDDETFAIAPVEITYYCAETNKVTFCDLVTTKKYIRRPGTDINVDDCIRRGTQIGPVEFGLILSMGHTEITLHKRPTVGVLSTGDELVRHFEPAMGPKKVVDTNGPMLYNLFTGRGYETKDFGICCDELGEVVQSMRSNLKECDVLVVTGGASMGSKDFVKTAIGILDGVIHFGRVKMKPGKPVAFASVLMDNKQKYIFSLPGNPVSAYITSLVLVLPFLTYRDDTTKLSLDSVSDLIDVKIKAITDGEPNKFEARLEFLRAQLDARNAVTVSVKQQSSRIMSLKDCNCLVIAPPSLEGSMLQVGQSLRALRLRN